LQCFWTFNPAMSFLKLSLSCNVVQKDKNILNKKFKKWKKTSVFFFFFWKKFVNNIFVIFFCWEMVYCNPKILWRDLGDIVNCMVIRECKYSFQMNWRWAVCLKKKKWKICQKGIGSSRDTVYYLVFYFYLKIKNKKKLTWLYRCHSFWMNYINLWSIRNLNPLVYGLLFLVFGIPSSSFACFYLICGRLAECLCFVCSLHSICPHKMSTSKSIFYIVNGQWNK